MNRIKKYIIAAAIVCFALVFAGCTEFVIDASINEDNTLTYSYKIDVSDIDSADVSYSQVKEYLHKVERHWENNGFDAKVSIYDNGIHVSTKIEEDFETREQAFAALYQHMTNDISPFVDVDYTYNLNYYYEDYTLDAALDFSNIIDSEIYNVYPDIVGKDVDAFLDTAICTVNISLPKNEGTEDDIISENIETVTSSLTGKSSINISGIINNNANKKYEQDLHAKRDLEIKNMIIFFSIALVLIVALIVLIVLAKKKKKHSDENIDYVTASDSTEQKNTDDTPPEIADTKIPEQPNTEDK